MAHTDAELLPSNKTERRNWPLAAVVWIDLALIVGLIGLSVLAVQRVVVGANVQALGLSAADLQAMTPTERIGLLGIRGAFLSTLLQNLICVAVPLARIAWIRREPIATIGFTTRQWPISIGVGLVTGFLAIGVNIALSLVFLQLFGTQQNQAEQFSALLKPKDYFGQGLFALLTIVVAPFGEETLFRGYLFNALRQNTGRIGLVAAYILSAGMFAAVHLLNVTQGQVALLVPIFVAGLLFAAAMHGTRSLIACVAAHATFNSLSTFVLLLCVNTHFPGCPV